MILNCHFKELNSPLFVPQDDKKGGKEQPILILNHLFRINNICLVWMTDLYPVCQGGFYRGAHNGSRLHEEIS
jgi:hypothetical protein